MFGFGNNPNRETYNELGRQAHGSAQYFTYITVKNCLPPKDGEEALKLDTEAERNIILECFSKVITEGGLDKLENPDLTEKINELAFKAAKESPPQLYENTLALLTVMNSVNGICKMYYVNFPKSKKLFYLVNDLAKVCSPAMLKVFGGGMHETHRAIWPHLSSIFEACRENC